MKIACPKCGREYRLDPSRIPAKGARFTCWGCQAKVEVRPLQAGQGDASVTEAPSSKDLQNQKQAISEAKEAKAASSSPPGKPISESSGAIKDDDSESFFTGPGIRKSTLGKGDDSPATPQSEPAMSVTSSPAAKADAGLTSSLIGTGALPGALKPQPLKITCPKCHHEYRIDPSRIPSGGGKFTCKNCQARIEVRPNQKTETKSLEGPAQKISTSKYQTPPVSQPPGPPVGLTANVADSIKSEEELNKPGPITGPFSLTPPLKQEIEILQTPSQEAEKAEEVFDGESTMVMGSPTPEIKQAIKSSKAESKEEPSSSQSEVGFSFSEPQPTTPSFSLSSEDATPPAISVSKESNKRQSGELPKADTSETASQITPTPQAPVFDVSSTLSMNNADLASVIESHTSDEKDKKDKEASVEKDKAPNFDFNVEKPSAPKFDFSFGETKAPTPEADKAVDDPYATTAAKAASSPKVQGPEEQMSIATVINMPAVSGELSLPTSQASDENKTTPLSPSFTFKMDGSVPEAEKPSEGGFAFTPTPNPPTLEKPSETSVSTAEKSGESLSSASAKVVEEEKKADIKIPPPALRPPVDATKPSAPSTASTPTAPAINVPKPPPAKADKGDSLKPDSKAPKAPEPKTPEPKTPKPDVLNKPLREDTKDLPTPVYNPDIFSPPPTPEEPASSRSGLFKGLLVGASLALVLIVSYLIFFRTPSTTESSPTPIEIAKNTNTPRVVETPDVTPTPEATTKATKTPEPVASTTPKATKTPEVVKTPEPTKTPTPKATKTPEVAKTPEPAKTPTPKATKTPEPAKTPTPKPTPDVAKGSLPDSLPGNGKFTVQVRATQSQNEAEALGKKLRGAGLEAYVVRADLGAKGIWYRVRVGRYQSFGEAQKAGSEVRNKAGVADYLATTY